MSLGRAIGRLLARAGVPAAAGAQARPAGGGRSGEFHEGPRSAYELVTRRALEDLARDFDRLETKVNGVIFGVVLTFALEVWKSLR